MDHQIKVRGFRIELGEIEAALRQHPSVEESVVVAREASTGDMRLAAYVVLDHGESVTAGELRDFLKHKLPDYMVPSAFVMLDSLPLNSSGKVDRKALPDAQLSSLEPDKRLCASRGRAGERLGQDLAGSAQRREGRNARQFFRSGGPLVTDDASESATQGHHWSKHPAGPDVSVPDGTTARPILESKPGHASATTAACQPRPGSSRVHHATAKASGEYSICTQPPGGLRGMILRQTFHQFEGTEVAVIGMAGRFPGARDLATFWKNLHQGVESIRFFTEAELKASGVEPAKLQEANFVKACGDLEGFDLFDAGFFGFSPRDAAIMDPQQRVFLECAWEALEDAGYDPKNYAGAVGVFAGSGMNAYMMYNLISNQDLINSLGRFAVWTTGNDKDFLTTRASYLLNLKGPSVNVQTACSTSLVAIHMASQSLLSSECDMALAGGVTILLPQDRGYLYREGEINSPDGHCRAFDAKAKGTVFGSGAGIVVLKRLADALRDEDNIYAIIKGSAVNNDGSSKVGYTAPSVEGQARVITEALEVANVDPETISYVEAHGTGTPIGDPIEVAALTQAFRAKTTRQGFCAIGSLKTNIGHLDTAAGVAGFIKTALALRHQELPPTLHYETANPEIDFAQSPFFVNAKLSQWRDSGLPRRAGVSSLGVGGTNAHIILEEAPLREPSGKSRSWQLVLQSARSTEALDLATSDLARYLKANTTLDLADIAFTLQVGRRSFNHRRMLVSRDLNDAIGGLESMDPTRVLTQTTSQENQSVLFMFPGQGSQYINMGRELYEAEPVFRQELDRCFELLNPQLGIDLRELLYPCQEQVEEAASERLLQTAVAQPAIFAIEYALAKLWMSWGVQPAAMIGHSIGEYVAACLAGVFSLENAVSLVAERGRLMQQVPAGAMLVVSLPEEELKSLLGEDLSLAAVNGPSQCVASGSFEAVTALESYLIQQHIDCRRLHTSHAFHSKMMDPILGIFFRKGSANRTSSSPDSLYIQPDRLMDDPRAGDGSRVLGQTSAADSAVRGWLGEGTGKEMGNA